MKSVVDAAAQRHQNTTIPSDTLWLSDCISNVFGTLPLAQKWRKFEQNGSKWHSYGAKWCKMALKWQKMASVSLDVVGVNIIVQKVPRI